MRPVVINIDSAIPAAASLFGISPPLAKLLLRDIPPVALAGLLYLGAFLGLCLYEVNELLFDPLSWNLSSSERSLPGVAKIAITMRIENRSGASRR